MSSSRTSPMKDAFKKLQVQSPYRLPKDGPGFTPPVDRPREDVTTTAGALNPRTPLPEVETTIGRTDSRSIQREVIFTKGEFDQRAEPPMVNPTKGCADQTPILPEVAPTKGRNDQRSAAPSVEATTGIADQKAIVPEVSSTSGLHIPAVENTIPAKPAANPLDAFLPRGRTDVTWREKGPGRLHIPHQLFEFAQKATSSRNELLIFNCLIRFSLGFHRTQCEAGYSFIAQWTGIDDTANVRKSMKTLLAAGLIVKVREADSVRNIAAVYEVPVVRIFLDFEDDSNTPSSGGSGKNSREVKQPLVDSTPGKSNRGPRGRCNPKPMVDSTNKKESINKTLKKAAPPIFLPTEEIEDPEVRKIRVQEAIIKFELAMTPEAQSAFLLEYEQTEFAHGFLPPRNVMRNMAVLHWHRSRANGALYASN